MNGARTSRNASNTPHLATNIDYQLQLGGLICLRKRAAG